MKYSAFEERYLRVDNVLAIGPFDEDVLLQTSREGGIIGFVTGYGRILKLRATPLDFYAPRPNPVDRVPRSAPGPLKPQLNAHQDEDKPHSFFSDFINQGR